MPEFTLFNERDIVGVFRGFQEGGLEFHADLVLPYKSEFQNIPMHGQFLMVQLENPNEAVLGRITSLSSEGKLSFGSGEEFNIRAVKESRPIPEELREQYLKYKVNIRVLGIVRSNSNDDKHKLTFVPSHRRLPHVGSPVAFPNDEVLKEIAGHNVDGADIGFYALGEYIYSGDDAKLKKEDWMQIKKPEIMIKFPIHNLVSRRSFVFARAGFGKSNLNKLLFSKLYEKEPYVVKKGDKKVPVGTVIFDPDGEYFWPDDKGRPGLCDVPFMKDKLVVFTNRNNKSPYYQSFVAGGIRLDIRRLRPSDVMAISLSSEKQDQQNVRKLKGLSAALWEELVNLVHQNGNSTDLDTIKDILALTDNQDAEALAARANMTTIVRMIHDPTSRLMDMLIMALTEGKLCVVDVSQMRGGQSMILAGLILRRIFDRNQQEFIEAEPKTIPTIAVIEEAQSVLQENVAASEPYIAWVKEGRKYDLGAVMITQQPGSIPFEILSQGDNWFVFHLLSSGDLGVLKKANAHYSEDLLSAILNEPITGQGVMWSSVGGTPYPISVRILSFENEYKVIDSKYEKKAEKTYAGDLKEKFHQELENVVKASIDATNRADVDENEIDAQDLLLKQIAKSFSEDAEIMKDIAEDGIAWGRANAFIEGRLPKTIDDKGQVAYNWVPRVLEIVLGRQNEGWHTYRTASSKTYIKKGKAK